MAPIDDIVLVATEFQPIVDIATKKVVAHEALSRFADAAGAVAPDIAFRRAYSDGSVDDVDAECIGLAVDSAARMGARRPHELFVNVEPSTLWRTALPRGLTVGPPLTVEITERALGRDIRRLLAAIGRLRELGHAIAVDDLGAQPATLALLPLIAPDVIKLDMGLIRQEPDRNAARIMTAIADHVAHSGALVLAEGIENEQHEVMAQALGATLGQGWHYGRPRPAEAARDRTAAPATSPSVAEPGLDVGGDFRARLARSTRSAPPSPETPFGIVGAAVEPRRANRALLVQVSTFLEEQAVASGDSALVLATFQHNSNVTPATARRYRRLIDSGCLLAVFTVGPPTGLPDEAQSHVIGPDEALAAEWDVIVLTADRAAALTAREVDPGRHTEGLYDFVLTTDRALVTRAARALMS